MHKVVFVDNERGVLDGLRRVLRPQRDEWDMRFCLTPRVALESLEHEPADVIVADLQMAELDGTSFFGRTAQLYPDAVRIVLSGHDNRALLLSAARHANRLLIKPCDPAYLVLNIEEALALRSDFENPALSSFVARMDKLPTIPSIYRAIDQCLADPSADASSVAEIVRRDPAITAKVLQLASSPYFGGRAIANIERAVMVLGMDMVKSLVLSTELFGQVTAAARGRFGLEVLWERTGARAAAARSITINLHCSTEVCDQALTSAATMDLGAIVLADATPDEFAACWGRTCWLNTFQMRRLIGFDAQELGGYVLGSWGIASEVANAVRFLCEPGRGRANCIDALTVCHVVEAVLQHRVGEDCMLNEQYLAGLGVSTDVDHWDKVVGG